MMPILKYLWLVPALPVMAAAAGALLQQPRRKTAAALAVGAMSISLLLSLVALAATISGRSAARQFPEFVNFRWFQFGAGAWVELGWMLDPLTAVMLVMVSFVGLLIFIYSMGYMAHDRNYTRFFCFLSLFAAGMLGLIIANSLLLFFMCWELVGLTSYLLIGFWYDRPSAAAAAKKAFITTRIGDLAFLLGMVWLYAQAGTLVFYNGGNGCLEQSALAQLAGRATTLGMAASTGIALLIFCGAIGKSGQIPLHVWLPDAMEGPTPVSALIHAATMVAAGVFLVARVFPLMAAHTDWGTAETAALQVVTWVGAVTAVFAASIAVAQTDIKRILAYSTVSQLGFMMVGLGVGGVAVGMFHLITHAFFKALLFMGAGSVIHGCHEEQDVRRMGGLRKHMPVTFATYAVGMLALAGFPLFFSGFWSKDAILHAAHEWRVSHWPYYLAAFGALLTAFYMTRQVFYVFFGKSRGAGSEPHESPRVMLLPLILLAGCSLLLGFLGTPAWPWFQDFLEGGLSSGGFGRLFEPEILRVMLISTLVVLAGMGFGYWLYGSRPLGGAGEPDPLEVRWPDVFTVLRRKYFVDEVYEWAVVGFNAWWARFCDRLDRWVWAGVVQLAAWATLGLSWVSRVFDEYLINPGFDEGCKGFTQGGGLMSRLQNGRAQHHLRFIGVGLIVLALCLIWGCRA